MEDLPQVILQQDNQQADQQTDQQTDQQSDQQIFPEGEFIPDESYESFVCLSIAFNNINKNLINIRAGINELVQMITLWNNEYDMINFESNTKQRDTKKSIEDLIKPFKLNELIETF